MFEKNGWKGYKRGFGSEESGDFWLGLEKIHQITLKGKWKIVFRFIDRKGVEAIIIYDNFQVSSEDEEYRLSIGKKHARGDIWDTWDFQKHDGAMFTTKDRDNDIWTGGRNCANASGGGFWFIGEPCYEFYPPTIKHWDMVEMDTAIAPMEKRKNRYLLSTDKRMIWAGSPPLHPSYTRKEINV